MVDLPTIQIDPGNARAPRLPSLPTPRVAETRVDTQHVITPQVSTPQVMTPHLAELPSPLRDVAASLAKGSDESNEVAKLWAKQAGAQAVTRDADGNLVIAQAPIVGDAAIAYHSAVKYTALTFGESEARRKDLVLSKQFQGNPDGYLEAAEAFRKAHVDEFTKTAGADVGAALNRSIENATTQNYRWLVLDQQRNIKQQFDQGTNAKLQSDAEDAISLIQSGAPPGSPEVRAKIDSFIATSRMRVQNPVLGESPDVAALRLKQFDTRVGGAQFVAGLNTILQNPAGGVGVAQKLVDEQLKDETLPPAQRLYNYTEGNKTIRDHQQNLERQFNIAKKVQKIGDEQFEDAVIKDSASGNPTITENDIKNAPDVSPEARMRMLAWQKRDGLGEPLSQVSQATTKDFFNRMNLPEGDPRRLSDLREVRDAYAPGGGGIGTLTQKDEEWLEKRFREQRSPTGEKLSTVKPQFFKAVDPLIDKSNPLLGKIDQSGKLQAYRFQRFVEDKVDSYVQQKKDPSDLFDPNKPDFLGRPEVLKPFQTTISESIKNNANQMRGGTAPARPARNPGETPDAYLKRVGGQ